MAKAESRGKFLKDLAAGQEGERKVAQILLATEEADNVVFSPEGKDHDFTLNFAAGQAVTYEVKSDFMAARTGNLFLEYSCNSTPSGLLATKADQWAILLLHTKEIFLFKPALMWRHLETCKYRQVKGGDGNRAAGYVVPIDIIRDLPFVRVVSSEAVAPQSPLVTLQIVVDADGTAHTTVSCGEGRSFEEVKQGLTICASEISNQLQNSTKCPFSSGPKTKTP